MVGLICLYNNCVIGCSTVMMWVVGLVVCWGFDTLVWSYVMCDLWVVCCVWCVVLVCVILML